MLDKKQIWAILFKFKMSHKAAETTHNIDNTFDPGAANQRTVQLWFKKFCKGNESLENEEPSGWPLEIDDNQLRESLKLILLQLREKLLTIVDHSMVIWHLKQIGKVKIGGCLMRKWKWSHSAVSNFSWPRGPSMGFFMQECWSGLPFPSPGDDRKCF